MKKQIHDFFESPGLFPEENLSLRKNEDRCANMLHAGANMAKALPVIRARSVEASVSMERATNVWTSSHERSSQTAYKLLQNGDGLVMSSGNHCGQPYLKLVHLAQSCYNATAGPGVQVANVPKPTSNVQFTASAREIVIIYSQCVCTIHQYYY